MDFHILPKPDTGLEQKVSEWKLPVFGDRYLLYSARYSITHDLRFLSDFAMIKTTKTYPSEGGICESLLLMIIQMN